MKHRTFAIVCLLFFIVGMSNAQASLQCGDTLIEELAPPEDGMHTFNNYHLNMPIGTMFDLRLTPIGQNFNVAFVFLSQTGEEIEWHNRVPAGEVEGTLGYTIPTSDFGLRIYGVEPSYSSDADPTSNETSMNFFDGLGGSAGQFAGAYEISIECDGVETPSEPDAMAFSGFGFPGLAPVDFSQGVELQLTAGEATLAPIAGDLVALYSYDASAGSTATLSLSRASGDISIGVTVIHKATNQIIFMGGMPFSDTLSVELSFPLDGIYVIGLFQLVTKEASETSGAVEILIESP